MALHQNHTGNSLIYYASTFSNCRRWVQHLCPLPPCPATRLVGHGQPTGEATQSPECPGEVPVSLSRRRGNPIARMPWRGPRQPLQAERQPNRPNALVRSGPRQPLQAERQPDCPNALVRSAHPYRPSMYSAVRESLGLINSPSVAVCSITLPRSMNTHSSLARRAWAMLWVTITIV